MNRSGRYGITCSAIAFISLLAGCEEPKNPSAASNPPLAQPSVSSPRAARNLPPVIPIQPSEDDLTPPDGGIVMPPSTPPAPIPLPPVFPSVPAVLPKPRMLGPVSPPVVEVARMAEPSIRVRLTDESPVQPTIAKGKYRGRIDIVQLPNQKYVAVNTLPMDQYLAGVLAKEMYGHWTPAAFRTQAIVARTYALYQMMTQGKDQLWDVSDTVSSQVYGGIAGETAKARVAVAATRGQVLVTTVQGKTGIFCTYFSSCSGGASQDASEAWGDIPVGTLRAQPLGKLDSACPNYTWPTLRIAKSDISRCINAWGVRNQLPYIAALGQIQTVKITQRNKNTGRPTIITLTDTQGHAVPMRAEEFRIALLNDPANLTPKPKSSWFDIQDHGQLIALTNGRGHGHGVGLSQWGAQAMSLKGSGPSEILGLYYPGTKITRLWH